ncbi:Ankrd44, partial [Symbiodinium sp. CCMP2456]
MSMSVVFPFTCKHSAWQDFAASLRHVGCNVILAKGFLAHHKVPELPTSADAARACALDSMSFLEKLSMAAGEPLTYVVPAAALAVAFLAVAVEACVESAQRGQHVPLPTEDSEPEASSFLKGARIQVAKARTEGKGRKLAFRALEVVVNGSLLGGMAMIIVWWPVWLVILAAVFVYPAACQYGLLQVVQVPALAIATPQGRSWPSMLCSLVLVGLVALTYIWGIEKYPKNPLMNDINETIIEQVWVSRTLSDDVEALPLLPKQYTAWAESLRCVSAQSIFVCLLCLQVVCLLVYVIALLLESIRVAAGNTATATYHGNEPGPTLSRQLANTGFEAVQHKLPKLTKVQWEQQHCFDVDALRIKVCFMALDVLLDAITIFILLGSRTACLMLWALRFFHFLELPSNRQPEVAFCLTFVVARSTIKQLSNLKGFKKAGPADMCSRCDDFKRVTFQCCHENFASELSPGVDRCGNHVTELLEVFDEQKGAEAFFSLMITSYSYVWCVQSATTALVQCFSLLLSVYGLA